MLRFVNCFLGSLAAANLRGFFKTQAMKVQLPWLNKASGRSAGTIYQSYWGATYTRSMPTLFHYPDTEKQQETQAKFYDTQRNWLPIYRQLMQYASPSQRKNKNSFNRLSRYVYKILNLYYGITHYTAPAAWGLERLNKMRPVITNMELYLKDDNIILEIDVNRPHNETQHRVRWIHILLFNLTQKYLLFQTIPIAGGLQNVIFSNTMDWQPSDGFRVYIALSDNDWLGNFNLCDPR